jgi:peptide methionine sulfoxide reductase MsrA
MPRIKLAASLLALVCSANATRVSLGLIAHGRISPTIISRRDALVRTALAATVGAAGPRAASAEEELAVALFSAGDARFLQPAFDEIRYLGVKKTEVGSLASPDGGVEAIRVTYDPRKLTYKRLLGSFWRACDPTKSASQGQFGASGPTIVWVADDAQRNTAEQSRRRLDASTRFTSNTFGPMFKGQPIQTEIRAVRGEFELGPEADQGWYLNEPKAYEQARKKTGRTKWFEDACALI